MVCRGRPFCTYHARYFGVVDVLDRIGTAGVFGQCRVCVINLTGVRVKYHILEDGAEFDSVEDVWFFLGGEVDAFGVAAAFDVEDAIVGPAVLVITDEFALGVGGEGGLAGAGKTEENCHVALFTFVGGGMEGQDVVLDGHLVKENCENAFLHFSSVFGTQYDHLFFGKVYGHRRRTAHPGCVSIGREAARIVNDIVRMEIL